MEIKSIKTRYCGGPNIIIDGFKQVCTNCGSVDGYKSANEFVDFYANIHRIRKHLGSLRIKYTFIPLTKSKKILK